MLGLKHADCFASEARAFAIVGPADESITGGPTNGMIAGAEDTENTLHILDNMRHVTENLKEFTATIKTRPYTLIRASNPREHKTGEQQ